MNGTTRWLTGGGMITPVSCAGAPLLVWSMAAEWVLPPNPQCTVEDPV